MSDPGDAAKYGHPQQFRNVPHGALVVYDVTSEESFDGIPRHLQRLNEKCGIESRDGVPFIYSGDSGKLNPSTFPKKMVIANKVDALTQKESVVSFD